MTNIELLLDSWKKNNLTPTERLRLLHLLENEEGQEQFNKAWQQKWNEVSAKDFDQPEVENRLEEIRLDIQQQISKDKQHARLGTLRLWGSVAAGLMILLIGSWLWLTFGGNTAAKQEWVADNVHGEMLETHVERGGRSQRISLSDGSFVWLNADSRLVYPPSFGDSVRKVWLEGEAYFDIAEDKDHPFIVGVATLETQVLGTSFYIHAYPAAPAKITLESGRIQVRNQQGKEVLLKVNDQLVSDPEKDVWEVSTVSAADMGKWKEGLLTYAYIPLEQLVPKLERWYGVEIQIDSEQAKTCKIYGNPTNKSLYDLLGSFETITGITYEVDQEGVVHISGGNCAQ